MKNRLVFTLIVVFVGVISYFLNSAAFLFGVFGVLCYFIYKNAGSQNGRFVLTILITGFLLRVFFAAMLHMFVYLKGYHGISGDDLLYTVRAWALVYKWQGEPCTWVRNLTSSLEFGVNPFTYILALFYKLFSFHPVTAKIINCIVGSLIGWVSYLIGNEIFDRGTAKIAMTIVIFYPSLVRWSVANLKDPLLILLFMSCVYIFLIVLNRKITIWKWALLGFMMFMLYLFPQKFHFALLAGTFCIILFFKIVDLAAKKNMVKILTLTIATILPAGAFYIFFANPKPLTRFLYLCAEQQATISKSDAAGYYLYTKSFMTSLYKGTPYLPDLLSIALKNVIYYMLTPFPWQVAASQERLTACPQMILWYIVLFLSIFGYAKLLANRYKAAFLLGILLMVGVTVSALAEGNIGAAFRHRDIFTPFFIIFASAVIGDLINGTKSRGFNV